MSGPCTKCRHKHNSPCLALGCNCQTPKYVNDLMATPLGTLVGEIEKNQWRHDAICYGHPDPELWIRETSQRAAKTICRTCPVMYECREYAIDIRESFGVWGGLNPRERRRLVKEQGHYIR